LVEKKYNKSNDQIQKGNKIKRLLWNNNKINK
jgi:hypothetical protein